MGHYKLKSKLTVCKSGTGTGRKPDSECRNLWVRVSVRLLSYSFMHMWVSNNAHLLLASLELFVPELGGLPWQKRRRCGHWPGLCPPHPAPPPGSWCTGPCVGGAPEEPDFGYHLVLSAACYWAIVYDWPPPCTQALRLKHPSGCWG